MINKLKKIHEFLSNGYALSKLRIGFPRTRNQSVLTKRLAKSGFHKPLFADKRQYLRNRVAESFEAFSVIQDLASIEGINNGKSVFWNAQGEPKPPQIWADAEIYFQIIDLDYSERFVKLVLSLIDEIDYRSIHLATEWDYSEDILSHLVMLGADVNAKDKHGMTPLHFAAGNGNSRNIKYLLNKDAVVDARSDDCKTPLIYAAEFACSDAMIMLLDAGADVNAHDTGYWTPLLAMAQRANNIIRFSNEDATDEIESCKILINAGGEIKDSFRKSLTSQEYTKLMCEGVNVFEMLIDRGDNPTSPLVIRQQAEMLDSLSLNSKAKDKCEQATLTPTIIAS